MKKKALLADLALLFVAFVWGTGFPLSKIALQGVSPMVLMLFRFSFAAIVMGIVFRKSLKGITGIKLRAGIISGVLLWGGFAFQTVGLNYTTSSKQAFLTAVYVVLVPFMFWFVNKKRPDIFNVVAAILTVAGIYLLTGMEVQSLNFGDQLTLVCAIFFAAQIIAVGYYIKKVDIGSLTVIQFTTCAILSLLFVGYEGVGTMNLTPEVIGSMIFLGLFSTTLAFFIQVVAQRYTSESHTAIIMSLEAVFGSLMGVLLLGEDFTTIMVVGCAVIFLGIITAETKWGLGKKEIGEES